MLLSGALRGRVERRRWEFVGSNLRTGGDTRRLPARAKRGSGERSLTQSRVSSSDATSGSSIAGELLTAGFASDTPGQMPSRRQLAVGLGYVGAAAVYVAIGVWFTDFLLSYFVGLAYLLLVAWLVPAGVRRLF